MCEYRRVNAYTSSYIAESTIGMSLSFADIYTSIWRIGFVQCAGFEFKLCGLGVAVRETTSTGHRLGRIANSRFFENSM